MPRAKAYKREEVLERAMRLFWQHGYFGTSLQQLERATAINRYGIYDSFGSKHALFLEALDLYLDTFVRAWFGVLERAQGREAIEDFFEIFAELSQSERGRWGCFVCNSAAELAPHDEAVAERVARYTTWLTSAFRYALQKAQEKGELSGSRDANTLAHSLTMATLGLFVYAKTPVSREMFAQTCRAVAALH